MHKPSFGLCPEGVPFLGFSALFTVTMGLLGSWYFSVTGLVVTFLVLNFFRDPERVVPREKGVAVSPADGKVVLIDRHLDPLSGEKKQRVCVFMNVFNVHVNRCAVTGTMTGQQYYPGKFINASLDKASEDNERNAVGIRDEEGADWTMVQIAGLVARRIVCWAEPGDSLARGQRFGLIKFGSRVDLYMPDGYLPSVKLGEKVLAGQTVLARSQESNPQS